jgi:AmiR/NasT family two-component response regulator
MPSRLRLALEIAAHEESERRALEGELAELENAWREAEEIAAIADRLLIPRSIDAWIKKHRTA